MSYSFCFGPSGAGKSRLLRKILIRKAQASLSSGGRDRTKYIVLVPEQFSMQTQRELVQDHPAHVLLNIDVLSFGRLAYRVFEETGTDRRTVLDDIGKGLLLRRVASSCAKDLQVLRRGIHSPGMIDEIKSVLSEFLQYGIGTGTIEEMAALAGEEGQQALQARLLDIKLLMENFQKAEADRYITSEETLDLLAKAVPKAESLRGCVVVFDGFTGFTTVQYRVVMALIRCAKEVCFSLTVGNDQGPDIRQVAAGGFPGSREALFYLSRKTVFDIIRMASRESLQRGRDLYLMQPEAGESDPPLLPSSSYGPAPAIQGNHTDAAGSEENVEKTTGDRGTGGGGSPHMRFFRTRPLAHLESRLFRYPQVPFAEEKAGETASSLGLFAASTPQEEVRLIFGQVQQMIRRTGCAYRDFAIVTADLETYGDLFELEAARYGIPVYIDRTSGAFHNVLTEGIRSVLQIASESFSYASVFRYLRSGLSLLTEKETDLLENYCLAHGVRGRKKWSAPFDADCEEARVRFLREVRPVTGLDDAGEDAPRRARTAAVRTRELYAFLEGCNAQARMDAFAAEFAAAGDVVREKQYRQIYSSVIDLLDRIYELTGEERMGAREYLELLEAGFSQIRLGTLPQRADRVLVGDMERTRLTRIRHLFFAGTNEGNIPRSASRGGILSDMDREFLAGDRAAEKRASGTGERKFQLAPTPRQQMFIQRLYLYLNMTKPSETLTVSFAKTSQDGKSLRPSYLISMLRTLFPALSVSFPETLAPRYRISGRADGLHILADQMRCFAGAEAGDRSAPDSGSRKEFAILYSFFTSPEVMADPEIRRALGRLREAALYRYRPELLRPETVQALYGNRIRGGISRMETASKCLLRHHLRYGLRLAERDLYEFAAVDSGTLLHAALQRFDALLQTASLSWKDFSAEDARRFIQEALRSEAAQYRGLLLYKSARDAGRLARFEKELLRTVDTLQFQIRQGDLVPAAAELQFGDFGGVPGLMPAIRYDLGKGRSLVLVGRIDRFDMYAEEGSRFLRIMDYKSGRNDLDPDLIRRGLQLQLITYMEALTAAGAGHLDAIAAKREPSGLPAGEEEKMQARAVPAATDGGDGERILPSAMLYYRITDPVIDISPQEAVSAGADGHSSYTEAVRKALRPTGLCLADDESIGHLDRCFTDSSYAIPVQRKKGGGYKAASRLVDPAQYRELAQNAREALCRVADRILDGEVAAEPARIDDRRTACDYCPYRDACGFDPRTPGYSRRSDT